MIDTDVIQCLLEDLLDRICSPAFIPLPKVSSSKSIENQFNQSIHILNNSIKHLLAYEFTTVVQNGQLSSTANIRHSRYYNPATTIKQANDLKKRLHWIEQRQMLLKQLNSQQEKEISETNSDLRSLESSWFDHRFKMLDNSLELLRQEEKEEEEESVVDENSSCARCRIYQKKKSTDNQLLNKIKHIYQIHSEHNYFTSHLPNSTPESDLIESLSKIADRIGHPFDSTPSNSLKKLPSSSTSATTKKKQTPKLHSSMSLIVGDSTKPSIKRTTDESRHLSNSNFLSINYDPTHKRQKRIASPQSTLSISSAGQSGPVSSSSPHEILTPSCRVLTSNDFENVFNTDQQENEDISDESFIHRHIRCELEQETWATNSLTSSRKNSSTTLQTSLSVPNGLSTTNSKQYRYRLTPNGIAYTETIDTK